MFKYIVKRLLLSIVILLGVSLIIYVLARLMPVDYIDGLYNAQLQQGTMTLDQVNQIKRNAGLYTPDGFLIITVDDENVECNGKQFKRDVLDVDHQRVVGGNYAASEWYRGDYYTEQENGVTWEITLKRNGTYVLYQRTSGKSRAKEGNYTVDASAFASSLNMAGLNGSLSYAINEGDSDGFLQFTVSDPDGEFDGVILRKSVSNESYDSALGNSDALKNLFVGNWETVDGSLRLTLKQDGTFALDEMDAGSTPISRGTYTVGTVADDNGNYELSLSNLGVKSIEYRKATFGEKAGAVLGGYFSWLWNMMRGNFGRSLMYEKPVTTVISDHMWISFIISLIALILEFVIAIPLGITSATHQYSVRDYTVTVLTMIGISFPSFFFAALLIQLFANTLGWFPTSGLVGGGSSATGIVRFGDMAWHLVLPMVTMVVLSIGGTMRYTRTNMLEVLNSDYIRTARAKGLSEKRVVYVHAFRNTLIPLMTILAGILPSLFGGAMITEEVFAIDGIGRIAYKSLAKGDLPLIMGYNMFLAILTVIGTLLSDIMYAVVDPRVKLTK